MWQNVDAPDFMVAPDFFFIGNHGSNVESESFVEVREKNQFSLGMVKIKRLARGGSTTTPIDGRVLLYTRRIIQPKIAQPLLCATSYQEHSVDDCDEPWNGKEQAAGGSS